MFKEVTYDRLLAITNTEKPYRHTSRSKKPKGSYPVIPDLRHHTHKYFARNKDGSFTIYYYGGEVAHVHKGNIIEMACDSYWQGERMFMTALQEKPFGTYRQGYWNEGQIVTNDESKGGLMYANILDAQGKYVVFRPLLKGWKYNMMTDEPLIPYDTITKVVKRSESAKLRKKIDEGMRLVSAMWKSQDPERNNMMKLCSEVLDKVERPSNRNEDGFYHGTQERNRIFGSWRKKLMDDGEWEILASEKYQQSSWEYSNLTMADTIDKIKVRMKEDAWMYLPDMTQEKITPCETLHIPSARNIFRQREA
jgi:hypothetical protein